MASVSLPKLDYGRFAKQGDVMLGVGVVVILFVMLVPLPTFLLDIMLCVSISVSLLILMTTMFMTSPLEFTIFPSLLLVTTLLRLALNVASTRLILLNGDMGVEAAGEVIRSFGEFVVGGSYVVGGVIFMILFILNKVVITSGTTRIAEVAARFTLDAMPGKQMAIEADLNAGLIGEEEATERRNALHKELKPLQQKYAALEGELEKAMNEQSDVETQLADPAVYADGARSTELLKRFNELRDLTERLMEDMAALEEQIAAIEARRADIDSMGDLA